LPARTKQSTELHSGVLTVVTPIAGGSFRYQCDQTYGTPVGRDNELFRLVISGGGRREYIKTKEDVAIIAMQENFLANYRQLMYLKSRRAIVSFLYLQLNCSSFGLSDGYYDTLNLTVGPDYGRPRFTFLISLQLLRRSGTQPVWFLIIRQSIITVIRDLT